MTHAAIRVRIGHSPDADDAFMHYGVLAGRVSAPGIAFEPVLEDIESLNRRAAAGELEVTAISFHALEGVGDRYLLLPHGGALGDGYGPVVVSRRFATPEDLAGRTVAVPGLKTTAALALRLALPGCLPESARFDEIEGAVREGRFEAGVLIHEGQLTFAAQGLRRVLDLGAWWKDETGLPLPLGGNAIRRDLGPLVPAISRALRESIAYGLSHREEALAHALAFARGIPPHLADRFVGLYVNEFTLDYGETGRRAIRALYDRASAAGLLPPFEPEFAPSG